MELIIVLLATAFGAAGALKLLAPVRGPTLASRFAERGPIEALAVASLPWIEFVLAGALLIEQFRQAAGVVCLVLLVVFSAVLVSSRRRGDALPCGCFGSTRGGPSWWPYARNIGLGALALVATIGGEPHGDPRVLALMVVSLVGIVTSAVLARELRQQGTRATTAWKRELGEQPLKTLLEQILTTTDGKSTSIDRWLSTGRSHAIVFVDPLCGPCRSLLPAVAALQRASGELAVATISRGPISENVELASEFGLAPVAVVPDDSLARGLGIRATPSAILITPEGHIVQTPAIGKGAILELLGRAGARRAPNHRNTSRL
jgi:hypothetical protein